MTAAHPIFPEAPPAWWRSNIEVLFGANDRMVYVPLGVPGSGHDTSIRTGI